MTNFYSKLYIYLLFFSKPNIPLFSIKCTAACCNCSVCALPSPLGPSVPKTFDCSALTLPPSSRGKQGNTNSLVCSNTQRQSVKCIIMHLNGWGNMLQRTKEKGLLYITCGHLYSIIGNKDEQNITKYQCNVGKLFLPSFTGSISYILQSR